MVKRCPAPPTWGQDGTSVATTLGNSHDVPVATFLSAGHVPVTSQGATFLQPHGKGRAMLTDEETSWDKERKVPGLVAKRRRSPGGCSHSHSFPGSPPLWANVNTPRSKPHCVEVSLPRRRGQRTLGQCLPTPTAPNASLPACVPPLHLPPPGTKEQ